MNELADAGSTETQGCDVLRDHFDSDVFYPGSTVYNYENHQFWSLAEILSPTCVYRPTSAPELAKALEILEQVQGKFAVRGGGHMANEGFNNINDGVLIVGSNLSTLALSDDKSSLSVGPALRWEAVYSYLESHDLAVLGGRIGPVGVPGLLLAGGISFYGNAHGWACDNVINFEVVLANGTIINANKTSDPDLFWALKGGSSNFGIVTKFDLATIPSPGVWAGVIMVNETYLDQFLNAAATYAANIYDPKAHVVPALAPGDPTVAFAILFYDSNTVSYPEILKPFTDIPTIRSTLGFKTLAQFSEETGQLVGSDVRDVAVAGTFVGKTREELLTGISIVNTTFFNSLPALLEKVPHENLTILEFTWQPIGSLWMEASNSNGGNALGFDPEKGVYICYASQLEWTSPQYDDFIYSWIQDTLDKINNATQVAGLYDPFKYIGDAAFFQPIFPGYGAENEAKLQAVAKEYDPKGVFQTLLPGGFKVF